MPRVCHIGRTSVLIGWVSGNPETFGATSKYFDIQANGNGQVRHTYSYYNADLHTIIMQTCTLLGLR